ncbi:TIGR01621 family pseudouridine synthase [Psychromonas ossibalaenae]|uniref:TIGR01621 family pseudouridine synthase n=1 Tax=Psychromonas ossibalaenae TaxID=444922 RepID=UPI00035FEE01|nr:TIGR01621 family pseudouridine synthase [Psychromonas ossibalaenae]
MPKIDSAELSVYNAYFSLVFENSDFVVINKQADINFHSEDGEFGVVVAAEKALACKLYSVHRLDKMTSGLLLLAKSSQTAAQLAALFAERRIHKYYLALSDKKPKKKQGLIKGGMEKSRRSMWKLTQKKDNVAITQFFSFFCSEGIRLFIVKPHSGKTHQIRVALKSIGSPVCGDPLYAEKAAQESLYDRGYLHAYQLDFSLNKQNYSFQALPKQGQLFLSEAFLSKIHSFGRLEKLPWPKT